jgi:hypothetical protein
MFRIHPRTLLKAALLPAALLMAAGGSQAASAATTANVTSGVPSASSQDSYYTMRLSPSPVTVQAGHRTRIIISFRAPADLYGTAVTLSVSGLPSGVTASFSPPAATVTAMTLSSDPIGTSTPLGLTISAP